MAADDDGCEGVAALAARADFDDWAGQPRRFLEHAREIGAVRTPVVPAQVRHLGPRAAVGAGRSTPRGGSAPRPLLVVHGDDDDTVPVVDARLIAQAHGSAELRMIGGAGHRLRHDPRAVAILLGWLDRQRNRAAWSAQAQSPGKARTCTGGCRQRRTPVRVPEGGHAPGSRFGPSPRL